MSQMQSFMRGFNTTSNSQDNANDNREVSIFARAAFEVGAYYMRAKLDKPRRVENAGWHKETNSPCIYVDGIKYRVTDTMGGCEVREVE